MADIVISVSIAEIASQVSRRTAVATQTDPFYSKHTTEKKQYSQLQKSDRITIDFIREAAKEVLKVYLSRQGDVVGEPYEFDTVIVPVSVKQKETVTLSGTNGYAYMTEITAEPKIIIFDTDLTTTASNFVTDNAAYYLENGIVLTSDAEDLIFEAETAGVPFVAPVVALQQLSMNGTTVHTTANATALSAGLIVYRFSENANPLSVKQTDAIKRRLTDNTKDAILYFALLSLYKTDGNSDKAAMANVKCLELIDDLTGDLYRLHD